MALDVDFVGEVINAGTEEAKKRSTQLPLLEMQEVYLIGRSDIAAFKSNAHIYLEIEVCDLDISRLQNAYNQLFSRHDVLNTVVHPNGVQELLSDLKPSRIECIDLADLKGASLNNRCDEIRKDLIHQNDKIGGYPLFQITVTKLNQIISRIHFYIDLLIVDGLSVSTLISELSHIYFNPEAELPSLEFNYSDYIYLKQEKYCKNSYQKAKEYWTKRLPLLPEAPELPIKNIKYDKQTPVLVRKQFRLKSDYWQNFKANAALLGLTPSMALCAAYAEVIACWSRKRHYLLNIMYSNRMPINRSVEHIVGNLSSLNILEVNSDTSVSFTERAKYMQKQLFRDLDNKDFNGVQVMKELNKLRGNTLNTAAPVVFSSNLHLKSSTQDGNTLGPFEIFGEKTVYSSLQTPQVWLDVSVHSLSNGDLLVNWDSREAIFPDGMMDDMSLAYMKLLEELSGDEIYWGNKCLDLIPERHLKTRHSVNSTAAPFASALLQSAFIDNVNYKPEKMAIVTSGKKLTYYELYEKSCRIGAAIQKYRVKPNQLVGVYIEKGWEQIAAVLGILLSGAAYLPIDPKLPEKRSSYLIENSDVQVVVTLSEYSERLQASNDVNLLFVDELDVTGEGLTLNISCQKSDDLAYVIYTSGSTGKPKGVMIDHKSALNTIKDINKRFNLTEKDKVLAVSALNFDLSVWDIFGTLSAGGTIIMPDRQRVTDPSHWLQILNDQQVTVWNSAPPVLQVMMDYITTLSSDISKSLRLVMLSGDWIPISLPDLMKEYVPNVQVYSLGGATEVSIWSIVYPIEKVDSTWNSIPYGKPLANQSFHVLNDDLQPCPEWVAGQMYIGGEGLAIGYWKDKEKTETSFIYHPDTNERLYRTGDIGRYLPDGNIEFLGREDTQVKIRGYRIELGEIEAVLLQHVDVESAIVCVQTVNNDKHIVVHIVQKAKIINETSSLIIDDVVDNNLESQLRVHVKSLLPEYMVPSYFVFINAIPLTANGKLDRRALPKVDISHRDVENRVVKKPHTGIEKDIARIWEDVLGICDLSITDNFFDLGGDSLSAVIMMAKIQNKFKQELSISSLLGEGSIESIASLISVDKINEIWTPLVKLQTKGDKTPIIFVHPAGGNVLCYEILSRMLGDDQPFYAFEAQGLNLSLDPINSIEEMAAFYINSLSAEIKNKPFILGGWSSGGVVAYEMAQQLKQAGIDVPIIVMLDSPLPIEREKISDKVAESWFLTDLYGGEKESNREIPTLNENIVTINSDIEDESNIANYEQKHILRAFKIFKATLSALRSYFPNVSDFNIVQFRATGDPIKEFRSHPYVHNEDWGWSNYVNGDLLTIQVGGDHYSMLDDDNIKIITENIKKIVSTL